MASLFGGFEEVRDERSRKRWFASAGTSLVIYAAVGVGLLVLARHTVAKAKEEPPIDVTFRAAPDVPEPVDVVLIYQASERVGPFVDQAIAKGARAVWLPIGVVEVSGDFPGSSVLYS